MYKECFKLMDVDKDGTISKNDLRAAFDNVGKLMEESELDSMLGEVGGGCDFNNMIKMFQEKMAGGKFLTQPSLKHTRNLSTIKKKKKNVTHSEFANFATILLHTQL
jgi:hypothetical protein